MDGATAVGNLGDLALAAAVLGLGYHNARADPVVRRLRLPLPHWPRDLPPLRLVLLSDLHAGNLAVDAPRLRRVVGQANALHPDLVLIAGDFLPGDERIDAATATAALAPLGGLQARLGIVAVPGNHDHWTGLAAVRQALAAARVTLLANQVQRRGPLVIGAVDDAYSGHDDADKVVSEMRRLSGPRVMLTHSPDLAPQLPPDIPLLLAGHTHCGQVVLPVVGSVGWVRYFEPRYRCGRIVEGGRSTIVTGGIGGTLPLRYGAPPDLWLLTLGPAAR